MPAVPAPEDSPNRQLDPVSKFRRAYEESLADARKSAETTHTDGWGALYHGRREETRKQRRALAITLRALADTMEDVGLDEDDQKALGEVKKSAATLTEEQDAFQRLTLDPVVEPVRNCERCKAQALAEATRLESAAPLHEAGLVELMRAAIAEYPVPKWDAETGQVTVADR